ncbi:MAG: alpha/beta fold hydrolase [archaeon]|nr:alpha/beta fold hydrolase [archaeon]
MLYKRFILYISLTISVLVLMIGLFLAGEIKSGVIMFYFLAVMLYSTATTAIAFFETLTGQWEKLIDVTDSSDIFQEDVNIPMKDGWNMAGIILKRKDLMDKKLPTILYHHGVTGDKESFLHFIIPIAMKGFNILAVDARGHGESRERLKGSKIDDWYITEENGIWPDLKRILDYLESRDDVDKEKIAMFGHSMGAGLTLSRGVFDPRIKIGIAMSPFYSWSDITSAPKGKRFLSEAWMMKAFLKLNVRFKKILAIEKKIAPKYFLKKYSEEIINKVRIVFARNDKVVLFDEHYEKIQNELKLPKKNVFITTKGGHNLRGQETIVIAKILEWLNPLSIEDSLSFNSIIGKNKNPQI